MRYHRLTREERYQIAILVKSGMSIRSTAAQLGRSASTISRELKRNYTKLGYRPCLAQTMAGRRRRFVHRPFRINGSLELMVRALLRRQWSPEQIVGRLKLTEGLQISHETIYRYIFRSARGGDNIFRNLRRKKKSRRSHATRRAMKNCGQRLKYPSIDIRPPIVEERERLGDYERDTIIGSGMHKGHVLLTIVDRVSRVVRIRKMPKIDANIAHHATVRLLEGLTVHTLTNDNGPEFAEYARTADALEAQVYFNDPYSSWQRGTNENMNGLIRQYFPRGTDFKDVTDEDVCSVEYKLNNRPRKTLGYLTPLEVEKLKSQVLH